MTIIIYNIDTGEDITSQMESFEYIEDRHGTYARLNLYGKIIRLGQPRPKRRKDLYRIYMDDDKGNTLTRIMEKR